MGASRLFPVVVVFLAGMALSLSCVVPAPAIAESPQIGKARKLVGDGKSYEAIQSLKKASQDARGQPLAELLNAQGWLLYREGRGDQAEEVYLRALAEAEKSGDRNLVLKIKNNLGINYYVSGRLDDAEKAFSEGAGMNSALSTKYLALIREQKTNSQLNQHIDQPAEGLLPGKEPRCIPGLRRGQPVPARRAPRRPCPGCRTPEILRPPPFGARSRCEIARRSN